MKNNWKYTAQSIKNTSQKKEKNMDLNLIQPLYLPVYRKCSQEKICKKVAVSKSIRWGSIKYRAA